MGVGEEQEDLLRGGHREDVPDPPGHADVPVLGQVHGGGDRHVKALCPLVQVNDDPDFGVSSLAVDWKGGHVLHKGGLEDGVEVLGRSVDWGRVSPALLLGEET